MSKAIIFGKFCPLHNGHLALIRATRALCDDLTIGLFVQDDDPISPKLRSNWLARFGNVQIILGSYEDINPTDFKGYDLISGGNPQVPALAQKLSATHFMWDPAREALPISSSQIMGDIAGHWDQLPDFVRIHAQKRLTFVGPESVGKSYFSKHMAEKYGGPHVPEYGRPHEKYRGSGDYSGDELAELARRHRASRNALAHLGGPVLFEDTDELMTAVWSEMLLGAPTKAVEDQVHLPTRYVLFGADTPWEEDSIRYFAKQEMRQAFFARIERKLQAHSADYEIIDGDWKAREAATIAATENLRKAHFSFR